MAYKLLEVCDCEKKAAIYSLLPALDRIPDHYHRLYAHIICNFPSVLVSALQIFADYKVKRFWRFEKGGYYEDKIDEQSYVFKRIREDKEYFTSLVKSANSLLVDSSLVQSSHDMVSAAVALLSHIYFDTFNNPVQAFLPESVYPSGQWNFWGSVGYLTFREKFYTESVIQNFRERLFNDKIWNVRLGPFPLIKSMLIRMGDLSRPGIEYEIVDNKIRDFLRFLDCNEYMRPDKELKFCKDLEKTIEQLIVECLNH
jgi:hypothetical protein